MVQTKCKLNNAELFVKLFYIQSKEIGNKKYYEGNKENLKNWVRVRLNIYMLEKCRWLAMSIHLAASR